jgi:hypothetical protein
VFQPKMGATRWGVRVSALKTVIVVLLVIAVVIAVLSIVGFVVSTITFLIEVAFVVGLAALVWRFVLKR